MRPLGLASAASLLLASALAGCPRGGPAPAGCDLGSGPCSAEAGAVGIRLELSPRPLRPLSEVEASVALTSAGAPLEGAEVWLRLSMPGMYMGENRTSLEPLGGGRYRGKAVLLRCASGRRDWVAEVAVRPKGGPEARTRFPFEVSE